MSAEFWMNLQSRYELESARYMMANDALKSVRRAPLDRKTGALKVAVAA
jgi:plasmid maintenance system antidote protein VapI